MNQKNEFDLVGIGRPFIDIIAYVDDKFLQMHKLPKGRGIDVSSTDLIHIRSELEHFTQQPGGAASNTAAGIAALGGRAAFMGKLADDVTGQFFRNAFRQSEIFFPTSNHAMQDGINSATCLILMTVDGSVTIVNNRGVADKMSRNDIEKGIIESSYILYVIAEMLVSADSRDAVSYAIDLALHANRKVALALNNLYFDPDSDFLKRADYIFSNMNEFKHNHPNRNIDNLTDADVIYVITDGPNGAHIVGRGNNIHVPVTEKLPNAQVTNPSYVGAGDQFSAGFLFGCARGLPIAECGALGAETALAVLHASGARPNRDLVELAAKYLDATTFPE